MRVTFTDGRVLSVPLVWFPVLRDATPAERAQYEIGGGGVSLHWPELDEDLSVGNLMAGVDWQFDVILPRQAPLDRSTRGGVPGPQFWLPDNAEVTCVPAIDV